MAIMVIFIGLITMYIYFFVFILHDKFNRKRIYDSDDDDD